MGAYDEQAEAEKLSRFLADVPDGAAVSTDPDTAALVRSMIAAAGRSIAVTAWPSRYPGTVRASWDGPAAGEHHEAETWL